MYGGPEIGLMWRRIFTEYAAGTVDPDDLWHAIDEFATEGRLPDSETLPMYEADPFDPVDPGVLLDRAMRLDVLVARYARGGLTADELSSGALEALGLAEKDTADAEYGLGYGET
jgi:hypothetical protein